MSDTVNTIRCVTPNTGAEEMVLAADQPQYEEVVVAKYLSYPQHAHGVLAGEPVPTILYRFHPTEQQRREISAGQDLFLAVMTFGRPPLPLELLVGPGAYQVTKYVAGLDMEPDLGNGLTPPRGRP